MKSFERQKPRSASEDRSRRRINVRTAKENVRDLGQLSTARNVVVSEDSGNSSLDTYDSDWGKSYDNQSGINRSDSEGGIKYWAGRK